MSWSAGPTSPAARGTAAAADRLVFRLLRRSDLPQLQEECKELFIFGADVRLELLLEQPERWFVLAATAAGDDSRVLGFVAAAIGRVDEFPSEAQLLAAAISEHRARAGLLDDVSIDDTLITNSTAGTMRAASAPDEAGRSSSGALPSQTIGSDLVTEVVLLGVISEWRRRRIATRLLGRVRAFARSRGCAAMCLHVQASNAPAIALYEGSGFEAAGVMPGYYDQAGLPPRAPPSADAVLYVRPLQLEPRESVTPPSNPTPAAAALPVVGVSPDSAAGPAALGPLAGWRRLQAGGMIEEGSTAPLAGFPPPTAAAPWFDTHDGVRAASTSSNRTSSINSDQSSNPGATIGDADNNSSSSTIEERDVREQGPPGLGSILGAVAGAAGRLLFGRPRRGPRPPLIRRQVVELGAGEKVVVARGEDGEVFITDPDEETKGSSGSSDGDRSTGPSREEDDSSSGGDGSGGGSSSSSGSGGAGGVADTAVGDAAAIPRASTAAAAVGHHQPFNHHRQMPAAGGGVPHSCGWDVALHQVPLLRPCRQLDPAEVLPKQHQASVAGLLRCGCNHQLRPLLSVRRPTRSLERWRPAPVAHPLMARCLSVPV